MTARPDHAAVDIGTVQVAGVPVRVCGRCWVAVDVHPTAEEVGEQEAPRDEQIGSV
jgi:hypothetical protein